MRYTPNLNLPVAEGTDTKDQYADNVEGPTKDALDTMLTPAAAHMGVDGVGLTTSWATINNFELYRSTPTFGWNAGIGNLGNSWSLPAGQYLVTVRHHLQSVGSNAYCIYRFSGYDVGGVSTIASLTAHWQTFTFAHAFDADTTGTTLQVVGNVARTINYLRVNITQVTPQALAVHF